MSAFAQSIDSLSERARRERAPGFDCVREDDLWHLRIWGFLPRDWCGNLALHCFAAGLDIRHGEARRLEPNRWVGSFLLGSSTERGAAGIDFLRMARHRPSLAGRHHDIALESFAVVRPASSDEPVVVSVRAPDRLGSLAQVLDCFAVCGLVLERLSVQTVGEVACDRFWLRSPDTDPRLVTTIERLEAELRERCAGTR